MKQLRLPSSPDVRSVAITTWVTPAEAARLHRERRKRGVSRSELLREFVFVGLDAVQRAERSRRRRELVSDPVGRALTPRDIPREEESATSTHARVERAADRVRDGQEIDAVAPAPAFPPAAGDTTGGNGHAEGGAP